MDFSWLAPLLSCSLFFSEFFVFFLRWGCVVNRVMEIPNAFHYLRKKSIKVLTFANHCVMVFSSTQLILGVNEKGEHENASV